MRKAMLVVAGCVVVFSGCGTPENQCERFGEVSNSLLPPTLIVGEAPMQLENRAEHHGVPGLSIAVVEDFELKWVHHHGVKSSQQPVSVSDSTLFAAGSLSKAVTAMTVLSMVEDGLIDLDQDVNEQLSSWQVPDSELTVVEAVTPRRLLNHTSGIMSLRPSSFSGDRLPSALQLLEGIGPANSVPVVVDRIPGTSFQYSNAGFTILRLLIEERSGQAFADVVAERVFEPLGMIHSTFEVPLSDGLVDHAASGHNRDGNPIYENRRWLGHVAAGGLWTTAADYSKLVIELQRAVARKNPKVLSPELARDMISPQDSERYGLGVFLHERSDKKDYVSHIGDGLGFVAGFAAHKKNGRASVVMSNGVGGIHLVREVMAAIALVYDWPNYLPNEKSPIAVDPDDLDLLAGRYRAGFDGLILLSREVDGLWLRGTRVPEVRLFPIAQDVLVCRERTGDLRIIRGSNGEAGAVLIGLADEVGRLPESPVRAQRMAEGELTPREMLENGLETEGIDHYRTLFAEEPGHPAVSENALNRLGYDLIVSHPSAAVAVFELNVELRPLSWNCYDSLGEGQLKAGSRDRAIANYRRSLELNPGNKNGRAVLNDLGVS